MTVDLGKRPAEYLVITTEDIYGARQVLHVTRTSDTPDPCWHEHEMLHTHTCTAVSHGHAAYITHREHALATAAATMAETLDTHVARGPHGTIPGWIAIRHTDGTSDGRVYVDAEDARHAQQQPCTVIPLSRHSRMTVQECEEYLRSIDHQLHAHRISSCPDCHHHGPYAE